jgi:quinoprotein glucose dehydrogenase
VVTCPPYSTPTNGFYGGHRKGDGLFGESLVALNARSGKIAWYYQIVHHGLWDYDLPTAPNLMDLTVERQEDQGRRASDQAGLRLRLRPDQRQAGVAHRGAAGAPVPCRARVLRQPFPTLPAPFVRQGVTEDDLLDRRPS